MRISIKNILLVLPALVMVSCEAPRSVLEPGDLIFQRAGASAFSEAISEATAADGYDFAHVGIFAEIDGNSVVIEASSRKGVVLTPLAEFIAEAESGVTVMRYNDESTAARAVLRAMDLLGMPYDWEFEAANGRVYCSELVQYSFVDAEGDQIFESIPMNFADHRGEYPQFWVDLFGKLGKPIPQGAPGTNPNSIATHKSLIIVKQKCNIQGDKCYHK